MNGNDDSPAPESADPALHDLYRRWCERARAGRLPSAREMDFDSLLSANPGAVLITIERNEAGGRRYRCARVGPAHDGSLGRFIEGYAIDELIAPQQVAHFEEVYDRIVANARPHYWMRMNALLSNNLNTYERLLVPVSEDGETVDALIGVWVWLDEPSTVG